MTEQIALVTGANKGIGREVARQLAQRGVTVLLGARDPERGKAAADELGTGSRDVRYLAVDVTDGASVAEAAARVGDEFGRLDILVNNAGVGDWRAPSDTLVAELRRVYETNVFGVVAVTNAMLPLLRRAPSARVVTMSSELGSLARMADAPPGYPNTLAYMTAKTALNAVTVQYARELRDTGVKVNAVSPGFCATDLNGHAGPRSPADGAAVAVEFATLPDDGPTGEFHDDRGQLPW